MKSAHTQITEVAGYQLAGRIGAGGMGDVYRAFHPGLNRMAAVKVLHQKDMAERFKNEAYIQSSVNHPNIARLYNYSIVAETPCIVMEYVEGETLDARLLAKGKLSNAETEHIILQVARALSCLHDKGILHRDIKPSNFKIQPDGTVKMLDFGISKNKYTPKLTQLGFVVGTTEYMAPEQFESNPILKSDIWSLAVMAYELSTGYMPFEASNTITLRSKITRGMFTNPRILAPEISEKLQQIIGKNIRANPLFRMTAKEMVIALEGRGKGFLDGLLMPWPDREGIKKLAVQKKRLLYTGSFILAFIVITLMFSKSAVKQPGDNDKADTVAGNDVKLKINVPGIANAIIIFPDGNQQPIPYEVKGKEGETVSFILHADGYTDKTILVDFTSHRSSYEYNLEKIKE